MQLLNSPPRHLPKKFKKLALEYAHYLYFSTKFKKKALLPIRDSFKVFRKIAIKYDGTPFIALKNRKTGNYTNVRIIIILMIMHFSIIMAINLASYGIDEIIFSLVWQLVMVYATVARVGTPLISRIFYVWNARRCINLLEYGIGTEATFLGKEYEGDNVVYNYGFLAEDGAYYKVGSANRLSSIPEVGDKKLLLYLSKKPNQGILYDDIYIAPQLEMKGTANNFLLTESGDIVLKYSKEDSISFLNSASESSRAFLNVLRLIFIIEIILGIAFLFYPLTILSTLFDLISIHLI